MPQPNIVLVLLDDATYEDVMQMQNVTELVRNKGCNFTRNYASAPMCCPSRASILTGQYPHNNGVFTNGGDNGGYDNFDDSRTIATMLTDTYRCGFFGKYLNGNAGQGSYIPPGWDTWKMPDPEFTYTYKSPFDMWLNGTLTHFTGEEMCNLLSKQARSFFSADPGPFFAMVNLVNPHNGVPHDDYDPDGIGPWVPPRFRNTVARDPISDPSFNEADVSDKPQYIQDTPVLDDEIAAIVDRRAQRRESLKAADEEILAIVNKLKSMGQMDNTYLIVASDNGFMEGQHRIPRGKGVPYEEAINQPLIIRGPGIAEGTSYTRVTGWQDILPTCLDIAGKSPTQSFIDGISLLSLLGGFGQISQRPALIDLKEDPDGIAFGTGYWCRGYVNSSGWKYVEYPQTEEWELYDLNTDPYEEHNLGYDSGQQDRVQAMQLILHDRRTCTGASCR